MPERNATQRLGGEAVVAPPAIRAAGVLSRYGPAAAGYALPFLLVLYLSLRGGGYDPVVRGEVGVAIWWLVLLGAVVGALPTARVSRAGWVLLALLFAFGAWSAAAIAWSESSERSVAELGRVAAYVGVFTLALVAQGRDGLRRTVYAVATAIAVVGSLALLSRLHPDWFPANETARFLPSAANRLSYPLNYWNGLAALIAIGIPLLLWIAVEARHIATRAVAAAAIPALCVAAFYTLSRGGAIELAVALVAFCALYPRLSVLPTLILTGGGAALLIAAALQRDELADGLINQSAAAQADEMIAVVLVVCAGVGLVQAALALAARYGVGPRVRMSRSIAGTAAAAIVVLAVVSALVGGVPGELADRWEEFKQPAGPESNTTAERFESASGNGRYQFWQAALDANASEPWTGIGPGTYEFWWSREGTISGFVRDAHSLYLETLAELGVIGLALIGGFVLAVLFVGAALTLRAPPTRRGLLAASTAACFAFATAAAIDWVWELAVLPTVFLLLAAGTLARQDDDVPTGSQVRGRAVLALLSVLALAAIAVPLAGTASVRASQSDVNEAQLGPALDKAEAARDIQPYAATPSLQQALVLELSGKRGSAAAAALEATKDEPTNWRTWLVLSRLEASRGNIDASIAAYRKARSLNPRSLLFE